MRLLVAGAGSTGGYFGARLVQAGRDVTFLVRELRASQLRAGGLHITSPHGDVTVRPQLVTAADLHEVHDVILLAVKGFQLEAALRDIAPAVGPETMILPVLNGMGHIEAIASRFSRHNVVGCALKVATVLDDDGRIIHLSPLQDLGYGELDGRVTQRIEKLDAFMRGANIGARLSTEIHREMWEKWILLAAGGAITCLMRGTVGEVEACPGGAAFALQLLEEAVTVVRKTGVPPSDSMLASAKGTLTTKGSSFVTSMYRDLQRGRPIEVENIIGDLVRRGQAAGIATPLLSAAYVQLRVYQNRLEAQHP
jgi:2-dehydropantoate 2-reductase